MPAAVALQKVAHVPPAASDRDEVLARYRRLRAVSIDLHSEILNSLSADAVLRCARRLGVAQGRTLILEEMDDLHFAFDLAIYTAEAGRSRAIDRYARSAQLTPGSDEALVLAAMREAHFCILAIKRHHETAGMIATDLIRGTEHWLVDIGLESSIPDGYLMATRLFTPDRFAMTAGVDVPIDWSFIGEVLDLVPQLARKPIRIAVDDRRFAEAIYRIALEGGIMRQMVFQDVSEKAPLSSEFLPTAGGADRAELRDAFERPFGYASLIASLLIL
jgi:hypothetical protein